jgi:RNA polymerase sigma-70 factor (ECF subfamily)
VSILSTDPDLLRRFRRGDREALERVYWAYVDRVERVVRYGVRLLREGGVVHVEGLGRDDVADLVQATFTSAFSERARLAYDGIRDYGPFLVTITGNLLASRWRKHGRELPSADLEALDGAAIVEEPVADEATLHVVREYLNGLPDTLRGVYEQRFVGGVSQEEAGRRLGLSRQQVRTLENRLLNGLAARLEEVGLGGANEASTNLAAAAHGRKSALK